MWAIIKSRFSKTEKMYYDVISLSAHLLEFEFWRENYARVWSREKKYKMQGLPLKVAEQLKSCKWDSFCGINSIC